MLTLHLQDGLGYSALRTGVSFVPFSIGIILGSAAAAPLGQRFGRAAIATGAAAITLTLASLLAVVAHYGTALHTWQLAPSLALTGIAFGTISGALADIVLGQVPARLAGPASGVVNTITQLGSVVAVTVTGAIFFGTLGNHPHPQTFVHATTNWKSSPVSYRFVQLRAGAFTWLVNSSHVSVLKLRTGPGRSLVSRMSTRSRTATSTQLACDPE